MHPSHASRRFFLPALVGFLLVCAVARAKEQASDTGLFPNVGGESVIPQLDSSTQPPPLTNQGLVGMAYSEPSTGVFVGSPSILQLPNGSLLAGHDKFHSFGVTPIKGPATYILRSDDAGESWRSTGVARNQYWSTLFLSHGSIYLLGTTHDSQGAGVAISRSQDGGATWAHSVIFSADPGCGYATGAVPVLRSSGFLWRGMEYRCGVPRWPQSYQAQLIFAPDAPGVDLLDPGVWSATGRVQFSREQIPQWMPGPVSSGGFLEGNAVETPEGGIALLLRCRVYDDQGRMYTLQYACMYRLAHAPAHTRTAAIADARGGAGALRSAERLPLADGATSDAPMETMHAVHAAGDQQRGGDLLHAATLSDARGGVGSGSVDGQGASDVVRVGGGQCRQEEDPPGRQLQGRVGGVSRGSAVCTGAAAGGRDVQAWAQGQVQRCRELPGSCLEPAQGGTPQLELVWEGFVAMPGGGNRFTVKRDPSSGLYLSLTNPSIDRYGANSDARNILTLVYSPNLLDWRVAATVLVPNDGLPWEDSLKNTGYQYADWQFDGDDLVAAIRTAYNGAHNFHDSNWVAFKRIRHYRQHLPPTPSAPSTNVAVHTQEQ